MIVHADPTPNWVLCLGLIVGVVLILTDGVRLGVGLIIITLAFGAPQLFRLFRRLKKRFD